MLAKASVNFMKLCYDRFIGQKYAHKPVFFARILHFTTENFAIFNLLYICYKDTFWNWHVKSFFRALYLGFIALKKRTLSSIELKSY